MAYHVWLNVPPVPVGGIAKQFLLPILSSSQPEQLQGSIDGRATVFVIDSSDLKQWSTSVYAIFQCGTSVVRAQYIANNGSSQLQTFRAMLSSMACLADNAKGLNKPVAVLPQLSEDSILGSPHVVNVDTCEGFWDPNANHFACGECTWWASYSRPDIGNPSTEWTGNANTWIARAVQDGRFSISSTPEPGAIAVWAAGKDDAGEAGHVAYVTGMNANGSFNVTEMNWDRDTYPAPPSSRIVWDTGNINFILGGVTFFENPNFNGQWARVITNDPDLSNNFSWGASSVFIPAGWDTIFYKGTNYNSSSYRHRWGTTGFDALESSFWNLATDNFSDSSNMNDNIRSVKTSNNSCLADPFASEVTHDARPISITCGEPPPPTPTSTPTPGPVPGDSTPPSASGFSGSVSGGTANLSTSGIQDNNGGSGVREVRFSAKFNNEWTGIGAASGTPYSFSWDMCNSHVPNGDVELGMEAAILNLTRGKPFW